jgi:hypothetical protein
VPIYIVFLNDAKRIDPNVLDAQSSCETDGIPKSQRQVGQIDGFAKAVVVFSKQTQGLEEFWVAPAVTGEYVSLNHHATSADPDLSDV